jgi:uncharacterized Zn finger protein
MAERRARARREMVRLRKKGRRIEPVEVEGRRITRTFWGDAWCEHLLKFASIANRLERGRTYVRNGSVCHLEIEAGSVRALVMGNELYEVELGVKRLGKKRWTAIQQRCAGSVSSLMDLLQGRLADAVMAVVTDRDGGLFPVPKEFRPACSCPDYVPVCKHVAAVFYGVGVRFDTRPELLFELRGVDHHTLVADDAGAVATLTARGNSARIVDSDLGEVFGIALDDETAPVPVAPAPSSSVGTARSARRRTASAARRRAGTGKAKRTGRRDAASSSRRAVKPGGGPGCALPDPLFAHHVTALRERLQVSGAGLARLLGMSAAAVSVWERRGKVPLSPHATSLEALERVWRMSRAAAQRKLDAG